MAFDYGREIGLRISGGDLYGASDVAKDAQQEVDRLTTEIAALRELARRATDEAEDLRDALRCLAEIGDMVGFGQAAWGADERQRLVREVRTALDLRLGETFRWPELEELRGEIGRLRAAVAEHHGQRADDRCVEDDDRLYAAFGLPPCDRRIGDPEEMLANCRRYIERRCLAGGPWKSYAELEADVSRLAAQCSALLRLCIFLPAWSDGTERWAWVGDFGKVPFVAMRKCATQEEAEAAVLGAAGIEEGTP